MSRFVIAEAGRCIACNTCMAACSTAHKAVGLQSQPRLTLTKTDDVSAPVLCRHCEVAFCLMVCPVNAIRRDTVADRVVVEEKCCIGCNMCALACPFGAITPAGTGIAGVGGVSTSTPTYSQTIAPTLAWDVGVRPVAVKCDLCSFRADGPACVQACPTAALVLVDEAALQRAVDTKTRRNAQTGSRLAPEAALALPKVND